MSFSVQRYNEALDERATLRTPRFILRPPVAGDIPAIVRIASDWEVASRLARMPHPYGNADARFFLETIVPAELVWLIVERSTGQAVGIVGLAPDETAPGTIELGYYVAREHWGRGIATEACFVVIGYGIGLVGRARLASGFFADNPASGRVLEKLGFSKSGVSERTCLALGASKPSIEVVLAD